MRFAVAVHGTRGDVEPCAAVARELVRRGHQVRIAVPPNLVDFVESAGLPEPAEYGVDSQKQLEADVFRDWWKLQNPLTVLRNSREYVTEGWAEMSETLATLAADADLILTGTTYQEVAANVAEACDVPLAALHYFPMRMNTRVLPVRLPGPVLHTGWSAVEWGHWHVLKAAEDAQRRALGLPEAHVRAVRRIVEGGTLELQAYDQQFFPGLQQEWGDRRPLIGSISLEMPTSGDDELADWIAAGTPPVYFGFGSMPVESPASAIAMITSVCAELGERALISTGVLDVDDVPHGEGVKLVGAVNHSKIFPACRAVVHHGGAGTTAASVRAGVPTVVLWVSADQPVWASQINRMKVGVAQRFSRTSARSLTKALRTALSPEYRERARVTAERMTTPAQSLAAAADLLEAAATRGRVPAPEAAR
ncbi:glycosyltransferase [Mycolicibacterium sp. P1-18]|uniref:glycosyltransferase n=1 Tax=Mycolicibacterium sp. P1-18 TaxID=2024615 RepID=UPI0011F3207B|nr:glycosyltransferase [Mycolicibacterium sp. P1-18]KAA0101258.1 glycosyltransferase [Mycolicibacterium sp. P1-18]